MEKKSKKSAPLRAFNALCAILLFGSAIYMIVLGFHFGAMTAAALSIAGVATPVILSGEGILEVIMGIFEAVIDGVAAIFDGIVCAISSIFG
jgi:hypothetical protein